MTNLASRIARFVATGAMSLAIGACDASPVEIQRWVPPAVGPMPAAVTERVPLPFCGVATNERDPAVRCLLDAWRRRQPVEVGIIAGPQSGNQVGILRLLPDMTVEILTTGGGPDGWNRATCRTLTEEEPPAIINVTDCSDPVPLGPPGTPDVVVPETSAPA